MGDYEALKSSIKESKNRIYSHQSEIKKIMEERDKNLNSLESKIKGMESERTSLLNDMSFLDKNLPWVKSIYNKNILKKPENNKTIEKKKSLDIQLSGMYYDRTNIKRETEKSMNYVELDIEIIHSSLDTSIKEYIDSKRLSDNPEYVTLKKKHDKIKSIHDPSSRFIESIYSALEQVMVSGLTNNIDLFKAYGFSFDKLRAKIQDIERSKGEIVRLSDEYGIKVNLPENNLYLTRFMRYVPNSSTDWGDHIRLGLNYAALKEVEVYLNNIYAPSKVFFDKVDRDMSLVKTSMEKKISPLREKIRLDTGY